jgi:hypothetical protein
VVVPVAVIGFGKGINSGTVVQSSSCTTLGVRAAFIKCSSYSFVQAAARCFTLVAIYTSWKVYWHDGKVNEANCYNINDWRLFLPTVFFLGHSRLVWF